VYGTIVHLLRRRNAFPYCSPALLRTSAGQNPKIGFGTRQDIPGLPAQDAQSGSTPCKPIQDARAKETQARSTITEEGILMNDAAKKGEERS
jgi:hypothetical protein